MALYYGQLLQGKHQKESQVNSRKDGRRQEKTLWFGNETVLLNQDHAVVYFEIVKNCQHNPNHPVKTKKVAGSPPHSEVDQIVRVLLQRRNIDTSKHNDA